MMTFRAWRAIPYRMHRRHSIVSFPPSPPHLRLLVPYLGTEAYLDLRYFNIPISIPPSLRLGPLLITAFGVRVGVGYCHAAFHCLPCISNFTSPVYFRPIYHLPTLDGAIQINNFSPPTLLPLPPSAHLFLYFHSHWLSYKCKGGCCRTFVHLHPTTTAFALLAS